MERSGGSTAAICAVSAIFTASCKLMWDTAVPPVTDIQTVQSRWEGKMGASEATELLCLTPPPRCPDRTNCDRHPINTLASTPGQ